MIDYSVVKCKLMEPRIGTGYTFSERSEFHGFFSDPLKWRILTRYQASTLRWKRFFKEKVECLTTSATATTMFVNTQDLEFKKVVLIDSPLPNYASVPTKNNLKSRLRSRKYSKCMKTVLEASTPGYCSPELKRNSEMGRLFVCESWNFRMAGNCSSLEVHHALFE